MNKKEVDLIDVFYQIANDETSVCYVSMGIQQLGDSLLQNHDFSKVKNSKFQEHLKNYRDYQKILLHYISKKVDEEIEKEINK